MLSKHLVIKYYLHICVCMKNAYDKYVCVSSKLSFTNIYLIFPIDNLFSRINEGKQGEWTA